MNVTLVTGASGGIGEAVVYRLAQRKQHLLLVARNGEKLKQQCQQLIKEFGIEAQFIAADLSKAGMAEYVFEETKKRGLTVDMLINNAGIGSGGEFTTLSLQSELDLIQLNISSLVALTHLFLSQMKERRSGTVINVASLAAFAPVAYMATYAASKMFVRSFTQAITQEYVPYNVRILLFSPGLTKTNFNSAAGIDNEIGTGLNTDYKTASVQTPEEVAAELMKSLDKGRDTAISGKLNSFLVGLTALLPNKFIVRTMSRAYRKRLKM